jgi:RNA 3'-terminal phosphate cyclase (ATP)
MARAADRERLVTLDGAHGEGGGQILRTALGLALLTGRPFRVHHIRANRQTPGLRPQHLTAVQAAAALCDAELRGAEVGSRDLTFRPRAFVPRDAEFDIGTAGATALVLHTLHLPLAMRAGSAVRLSLTGGTFNTKAPSFPYLLGTWAGAMRAIGLSVAVAMPAAGFYPIGGGRLEAWIEPGTPQPLVQTARGGLRRITGVAGSANLHGREVAERLRERAIDRLAERGLEAEIALADWPSRGRGAALSLTAEHDGGPATHATFVGLGERGKPAARVADEAVDELLAHLDAPGSGAIDEHLADQLLLPLALAEGRSVYTVAAIDAHVATNVATIRAFLDREIRVEPADDGGGRVVVG